MDSKTFPKDENGRSMLELIRNGDFKLKKCETVVKQRLPTDEEIQNARKLLETEGQEINPETFPKDGKGNSMLELIRNKNFELKKCNTRDKQRLPTAEEIKEEKQLLQKEAIEAHNSREEDMEAYYSQEEAMEAYYSQEEEDSMNYEHKSQQVYICKSCEKQVDTNNCLYHSCHFYHKECVKCVECNKTYKDNEDINDYVCITPGIFLCIHHYNDYLTSKTLNQTTIDLYNQKIKKNLVNELFNTSNMTDDLFTQEVMEDTFKKKIYEDIIPTATFHFDISPHKIDYNELQNILGHNVIILSVEKGTTIIKIAFLSTDFGDDDKSKYQSYVNDLKGKFETSFGKSIVGNLVEEPLLNVPSDEQVKEILKNPSLNLLQNTIDFNKIEINEIKEKVIKNLQNDKDKENWNFIFNHEDLFDQLEDQLRKDLKSNPFELIINGQTIIANKHFEDYNNIKKKIPLHNITERILYHGARLVNHQKIVNNHFLMPGENLQLWKKLNVNKLDGGFYGQGIYTTENIFYALMYANITDKNPTILKINQKAHILCCQTIYNNSKIKDLTDLSFYGKKIEDDIKYNYGINHALVGNANNYHPIKECDKEKNPIHANEYVFANSFQLFPCCSVSIKRKDYYILWKDENVQNGENADYMKQLSKKMEINIYAESNVSSALEIIRTKKFAKIKLITNGGKNLTGKTLIEQARSIIGSNFVCLVFAGTKRHMEWVSKMENVLFTTSPKDFNEFAEIDMNKNDILAFTDKLKNKYETDGYKFKINESQLLYFPKVYLC